MREADVIVRVAACTLLLLLAALLLRDARRDRVVWFLLPFALGLCGFLAGNTPDQGLRFDGLAGSLASLLSGSAALFLWWFCLAVFDDEFRLRPWHWLVATVWLGVALIDRDLLFAGYGGQGLSWVLIGMAAAMAGHVVWRVLRDRADDLVEARRGGRVALAVVLVGFLGVDLAVDLILGLAWKPQGFTLWQNSVILLLALYLAHAWLRGDAAAPGYRPAVAAPADRRAIGPANPGQAATEAVTVGPDVSRSEAQTAPAEPAAAGPEARLLQRLHWLMGEERVYRDPGLTFAAFAAQLGAPEPEVRRLVNQHLGGRHFRSFLNGYRIAEAKAALADPARAQQKMIAIAFDAGFASLASFNRAFKQAEGVAPSEYRAGTRKSGE